MTLERYIPRAVYPRVIFSAPKQVIPTLMLGDIFSKSLDVEVEFPVGESYASYVGPQVTRISEDQYKGRGYSANGVSYYGMKIPSDLLSLVEFLNEHNVQFDWSIE